MYTQTAGTSSPQGAILSRIALLKSWNIALSALGSESHCGPETKGSSDPDGGDRSHLALGLEHGWVDVAPEGVTAVL